jgi:hypothetical protein
MVRSWEQHLDKNLALQWGIPMVSNWAKRWAQNWGMMKVTHLDWNLVSSRVVRLEKHWDQHLVMPRETVSALRLARKKAKRLVMR